MKIRISAFLAAALLCAGCGFFKKDDAEEAPPPDACPRVDPAKRVLTGAAVRQPQGVAQFDLVRIDGKAHRSGALSRIRLDESYTFKARADGKGGFTGRRGATATPVAGVAAAAQAFEALSLDYTLKKVGYTAEVAIGAPTRAAKVATTGQARYAGPVRLTLQSLGAEDAGTPLEVTGTVRLDVLFGSRLVDANFTGLKAAGADLPFDSLAWSGIGLCNTRVATSGQGRFQTRNGDGRAVNFTGSGAGAPAGAAVLDATLYGFDETAGLPAEIGGVLLIQGDSGIISGIFAADLQAVAPAPAQ